MITTTNAILEMTSVLQTYENNAALREETNFAARAEAIDFIEFHVVDRVTGLPLDENLNTLRERALRLKNELEKIDLALYGQLREKIRTGLRGTAFKALIHPECDRHAIGYDNLDIFVNGLLSDQTVPLPILPLEPEMISYQKTPARIILEMTALAKPGPEDLFFDLGSGLGQATILVHLLSGARAIGIEYEPAFCDYASACATQLNLHSVSFINSDARNADYRQGTIFFIYTPFTGAMLETVMQRLQLVSQIRRIKIFSYGPCSSSLAQMNWMDCLNGDGSNPNQLYEFGAKH